MAKTRVVLAAWDPAWRNLLTQWADTDGKQRAERVAAAQRAAGVQGVGILRDVHSSRVSLHIGSYDERALYREYKTGRIARSLGAAG